MDIRGLRYFVEVVRQNSFTRAAEVLFLTQPTISKMVRQLEDELGTPLLNRQGKRFQLTDAGRVTYERGLDVLAAQARLQAELADLGALARGRLSIGLSPMVGSTFFAPVLQAYRSRHPQVELKIVEDGALAIETEIAHGRLDVGVTVLPTDPALFETRPFAYSELCLLAPRNTAWASRATVGMADLANESFILYNDDFVLSGRILEAGRLAGFSPNIASRSNQWDFIAAMVGAGLGIALLPRILCEQLSSERFCWLPLTQPVIPWHLALIWNKGGYLSHAGRAFVTCSEEILGPAYAPDPTHLDAPSGG
ncbi:MAG: LysR family transcriptional regulator [Rhodocyclales bacterium GT-UBC]|nr:MAG: LysR family transcriptional regulator [Rhodocyclales bacterium GT-UBC]